MFCEIYLQSAAHIITDPRFIYLFYFQVLFNRSSILDPDFPVNLKVYSFFLLTTEVSVVPNMCQETYQSWRVMSKEHKFEWYNLQICFTDQKNNIKSN